MLILGIDPGTATTGFGVIKTTKSSVEVMEWGLIETSKDGTPGKRLENINRQVGDILKRVKPEIMAIERLFFANNAKTAMAVEQAKGVMIFTASTLSTEVIEYAPGTVKKMVAGNGRADKKLVQQAVRRFLGARVKSKAHGRTHFDNAADALAVALCHAFKVNGGGVNLDG